MENLGALTRHQGAEANHRLKTLRPLVKKVLQGGLIRSDVANQEAADARRVVVTVLKFINEAEKKVTRPLNQAKKAAMDLFKPMKGECKEALEHIDGRMDEFGGFKHGEAETQRLKEQEREERRLAQLRRNEEKRLGEARTRGERLEVQQAYDQKEDLVRDEARAAQAVIVEAPEQTQGTQVRKLWDFEVLDLTDVPDEFLIFTVNRKKVLEVCREVAERGRDPQIRGLKLFQKPSRASRSL